MDYSNTYMQEKHEVFKWSTVANLNYILKTIFSVLHYTFAEQLDSVFTRYAVSMVIQNFTMNP